MSSFVHVEYPAQHPGVARMERSARELRRLGPAHAALHALASVGAPLHRAAAAIGARYAAWRAARRQAAEDQKLWNLALQDARVMADLSRAMSSDALRDAKAYY